MTLPTTLDSFKHYLPERPPARISNAEIEALNFLKNNPADGVVLTAPHDKYLKERFTEPVPVFAYIPSSYISAFSKKEEYIADVVNLDILGIDYKGRLQAQKDILAFRETIIVTKLLKENNIEFIYLPKVTNITPEEAKFGLKKVFENSEVVIYQII